MPPSVARNDASTNDISLKSERPQAEHLDPQLVLADRLPDVARARS